MQNNPDSLNDLKELNLALNLASDMRFYAFSMMEITTEKGIVLKNEITKTVHSTILKSGHETFSLQIESFDIELKNRTFSISEKEYTNRIAEVNDNILIQINDLGQVNKLLNHKEMKQRLEIKIAKLSKNHVGEKVEASFQYLRNFYKDQNKIMLDAKNYKQYGLFLHALHGKYTPETIKKRTVRYLNFMENTVVNIEEHAKVKKIKISSREVEIAVSGRFVEPFYESMFLKSMQQKQIDYTENDKISLDKYEGDFIIDIDSGIVRNASLFIEFSFGKDYKKTIEYQLNEVKDADND
jgi:hypothetical protein